jgi:hypothetical protein
MAGARARAGKRQGRGEDDQERKRMREREQGVGVWVLIPSLGRQRRRGSPQEIDDGRRATVLLHCGEEDDRERSWAGPSDGLRPERERGRVGLETAQGKEESPFFSKSFSIFCFPKILCDSTKRFCRFKIVYENLKLFSLLHNK